MLDKCFASLKVILILLLFSTFVSAKCPFNKYVIQGIVKDTTSRSPVEDAKVLVFFDEYETTKSSGIIQKNEDVATTSLDGSFKHTSYINSFSFRLLIDVCWEEPEMLEVVIFKEGYLAIRKLFKVSDLDIGSQSDHFILNVPPIFITRK